MKLNNSSNREREIIKREREIIKNKFLKLERDWKQILFEQELFMQKRINTQFLLIIFLLISIFIKILYIYFKYFKYF